MREDRLRLLDIVEAIERIEQYTSQGRAAFEERELVQVWVIHHLQIIGEAVGSLSDNYKKQHFEVPWAQIVAMRNLLVHVYFGVDLNEIWKAVDDDIPVLKSQVYNLLAHIDDE